MATVKKPVSKTADPLNVQATIMAVREEIMRYYKDTCVERVTSNRNINRRILGDYMPGRPRYQYQREEQQRKDAQLLLIGQYPIAVLKKLPDHLLYLNHVLSMSPALEEVGKAMRNMMSKYLKGVVTEDNVGNKIAEGIVFQIPATVNDKELFVTEPYIEREGATNALDWMATPHGQYTTYTTVNSVTPFTINSPTVLTEEQLNQYMGRWR